VEGNVDGEKDEEKDQAHKPVRYIENIDIIE
jgi:hypothetical protein